MEFLCNAIDACMDFDIADLEEFTIQQNNEATQINVIDNLDNVTISDVPFGRLRSDWSRLILLHDLLPEDSLMRTNLKLSFCNLKFLYHNITQTVQTTISIDNFTTAITTNSEIIEPLLTTTTKVNDLNPTTVSDVTSELTDSTPTNSETNYLFNTITSINNYTTSESTKIIDNLDIKSTTILSNELIKKKFTVISLNNIDLSTRECEKCKIKNTKEAIKDINYFATTTKLSNKAQEYYYPMTTLSTANVIETTTSRINITDMIRHKKNSDIIRLLILNEADKVKKIQNIKLTNTRIINSTLMTNIIKEALPTISNNFKTLTTGLSGTMNTVKDCNCSLVIKQPTTIERFIFNRKTTLMFNSTTSEPPVKKNTDTYKPSSTLLPDGNTTTKLYAAPISLFKQQP